MRTTLELDDDIVAVGKQLAAQRHLTLGQVISDLARQGLALRARGRMRNGVPLFTSKPGAREPGVALVNQLRDEE